jgi:hypothetical protein
MVATYAFNRPFVSYIVCTLIAATGLAYAKFS